MIKIKKNMLTAAVITVGALTLTAMGPGIADVLHKAVETVSGNSSSVDHSGTNPGDPRSAGCDSSDAKAQKCEDSNSPNNNQGKAPDHAKQDSKGCSSENDNKNGYDPMKCDDNGGTSYCSDGVTPVSSGCPGGNGGGNNLGSRSLLSFLASDGGKRFGTKWGDYDIATELIKWVIRKNPSSEVALLKDGTVALTAFVPNDLAFKKLAKRLGLGTLNTERAVYKAIKSNGRATVENILDVHLVPTMSLDREGVIAMKGQKLGTSNGKEISVRGKSGVTRLMNPNTQFKNAKVLRYSLNSGNYQIAHSISNVLVP